MEQNTCKGATAPLTLERLLDTRQAIAVLPNVLYFATTGECLTSYSSASHSDASTVADAVTSEVPAASQDRVLGSKQKSAAAQPTPAVAAALRDFFLKENPWVEGNSAAERSRLAIPTTSAVVGSDAVFVAPRGIPPYVYRPFFADFGPLDLGCCVHFSRRLQELLQVVSQVDLNSAPGTPTQWKVDPMDMEQKQQQNTMTKAFAADSPRRQRASSSPLPAVNRSVSTPSFSPSAPTTLPIVICASLNAQERVNVACLLGAFCVLVLGWSTAATWSHVFADVYPSFLTYRDASAGVSNYPLTLQDIWSGLEQAVQLGWIGTDHFDLASYWKDKAEDMSWIVPRRFLAMSSPRGTEPQQAAEVLAVRLRAMNVRLVIRLNDSLYNPAPMLRRGIRHVDLPYADGSTPNDATLLQFLQTVEKHFGEAIAPASMRQWWSVSTVTGGVAAATGNSVKRPSKRAKSATLSATAAARRTGTDKVVKQEPQYAACSPLHSGKYRGMPDTRTALPKPTTLRNSSSSSFLPAAGDLGAVAVHCLAGLGRTGTMIAVYVMRHYGFTARGVIGWMRLCRPGSITGVQQQYLDTIERRLRPSPYVFAMQNLKDFLQPLRQTSSASTSSTSTMTSTTLALSHTSSCAAAATLSETTSPRNGSSAARPLEIASSPSSAVLRMCSENAPPRATLREESILHTEPLWQPSPAVGMAAFQTHGNVVGDARPLTGVGGSLAPSNENGQWGETPWSSGSPLRALLLRRTPPLPPQRRRTSTSSNLSLITDHPDSTALDAVSSMPVLGTSSIPSADGAPVDDSPASTTPNTAVATPSTTGRPLPHAGDYKYVSTYFVALERANQRSPLRNSGNSGGGNTSTGSPARTPYPVRSKTATGSRGDSANRITATTNIRAATAGNAAYPRSGHCRLDHLRLQQKQLPLLAQTHCTSVNSSVGADSIRDHALSRTLPTSYRRFSSTSITAQGSSGGGSGAGDGSTTTSAKRSADDAETTATAAMELLLSEQKETSSTPKKRFRDANASRLRKTPQKPATPSSTMPVRFKRESERGEKGGGGEDGAFPGLWQVKSEWDSAQGLARLSPAMSPIGLQTLGVITEDGAVTSSSQRSAMIVDTVLPLWGRPVGRV